MIIDYFANRLQSLHIMVWIVTFILSIALSLKHNVAYITVFSTAGAALLLYTPAALWLSIRDCPSSLTHAGRELIYLAIQIVITAGWSYNDIPSLVLTS